MRNLQTRLTLSRTRMNKVVLIRTFSPAFQHVSTVNMDAKRKTFSERSAWHHAFPRCFYHCNVFLCHWHRVLQEDVCWDVMLRQALRQQVSQLEEDQSSQGWYSGVGMLDMMAVESNISCTQPMQLNRRTMMHSDLANTLKPCRSPWRTSIQTESLDQADSAIYTLQFHQYTCRFAAKSWAWKCYSDYIWLSQELIGDCVYIEFWFRRTVEAGQLLIMITYDTSHCDHIAASRG